MKFGAVPIMESAGAIVAHAIHHESFTLKKGDTVTERDIAALASAGIGEIVVARLEASDISENEAARQLAGALAGEAVTIDRAFTGRANIFAQAAGILRVDVEGIDRVNGITEAITLATLPGYRTVTPGEMVATVKIIPFAEPRGDLDRAIAAIGDPLVDVSPFRALSVGVISTLLPGLKATVITKTLSHLADRLAPAGARIVADERVAHDTGRLCSLLRSTAERCDLVVIFGASAITDRRDVIPAALIEAGGEIEHFGMPVDPGNLLLLGRIGAVPVIGAPGCARSAKENGFDWVLHRLLAGVPVGADDIRRLGVGGLLMEIVSRPQLRSGADKPKVGQRSGTTIISERRGGPTP